MLARGNQEIKKKKKNDKCAIRQMYKCKKKNQDGEKCGRIVEVLFVEMCLIKLRHIN